MKILPTSETGSVTAPEGFLAAGVFCDIKRLGTGKGSEKGAKRDLGLLVSEVPATAAGQFTTNQVCAAPVRVCLEHLDGGVAQAVVVNSGNANACTGPRGLRDARAMAALTAKALHMPPHHVLVGSTGRIGVPLPMPNVARGIALAVSHLERSGEGDAALVEAIMTSDTQPKQMAVEVTLSGRRVRLGGIAKGAGMIQPRMHARGPRPAPRALHATMLCFLTTDAAVERATLARALDHAVARSFNRITVDGDMSTNDTVTILANGLAGNPVLRGTPRPGAGRGQGTARTRRDLDAFQEALEEVCLELAKMIVRDGEGAGRFIKVTVHGARNDAEADAAARAVANSALVKTSWCGGDPNWGRVMDALGYSPAVVVERRVDIGYRLPHSPRSLWSVRGGRPTRARFSALCALVAAKEFELCIDLHLGTGTAVLYTCDLTEEYVDFNKGDVNTPGALGG